MAYKTTSNKIKLTEAPVSTTPTVTPGQVVIYDDGTAAYDNSSGERVVLTNEQAERYHAYQDITVVPSPDSYFTTTANTDGTVTITGITDSGKAATDVVLPYKIGNKWVKTINLPNNSESDTTAFKWKTLVISGTYKSLGSLRYITSLQKVKVCSGVTSISATFANNKALTEVELPDTITEMAQSFCGTKLSVFIYPPAVKSISNDFTGSSVSYIEIPPGVTELKQYAAYLCSSLKYIKIPPSVTTIHNEAIDQCSKDLTIICQKGSAADTYAQSKNIKVSYDAIAKSDLDDIDTKIASKASSTHTHDMFAIAHNNSGYSSNNLPPAYRSTIFGSAGNLLAMRAAQYTTLDYSTDGCTTWNTYDLPTKNKVGIFNSYMTFVEGGCCLLGGPSTTEYTVGEGYATRITVETNTSLYGQVNLFYCWFTSNGTKNNTVTIEYATNGDPTTFKTLRADVPIAGWSGPNIVAFPDTLIGGNIADNAGYFRFTFKCGSRNSGTASPQIGDIRLYANRVHSASNMQRIGTPYAVITDDSGSNSVVFNPTNIRATLIGNVSGTATAANRLATARNINITGETGTGSNLKTGLITSAAASFDGTKDVNIKVTEVKSDIVTGLHKVATSGSYSDLKNTPVTGTSSTAGLTKLYTTLGDNVDGSVTQKLIKAELDKKANASDLTTVMQYSGTVYGSLSSWVDNFVNDGIPSITIGTVLNIAGNNSDQGPNDIVIDYGCSWSLYPEYDLTVTQADGTTRNVKAATLSGAYIDKAIATLPITTDQYDKKEITFIYTPYTSDGEPLEEVSEVVVVHELVTNATQLGVYPKNTDRLKYFDGAIDNRAAEVSLTINWGKQDYSQFKYGDNVVWNGEMWDKLATSIDLTSYATKTYLDEQLAGLEQVIDEVINTQKSYMCEIIRWSDSDADATQTTSETGGTTE